MARRSARRVGRCGRAGREAAEGVNRSLEEGDAVTQFEAATAATFVALATARVKVAAIEAGLGGRLDATNTIPSRVTVLTSIGLDHTEWLGKTELEIAAEKLAVLRDQTTLVLGRVSAEVEALAERTAAERGARLLRAPEDPGPELRLLAPGGFQRRNFALARTAAEAFLGELDPASGWRGSRRPLAVPGRLERIAERAADLRRRRPQPRRRRRAGRGAARLDRSAAASSPAWRSSPTRTRRRWSPRSPRPSTAPSAPSCRRGLQPTAGPAPPRPAGELSPLCGGRAGGGGRAGASRRRWRRGARLASEPPEGARAGRRLPLRDRARPRRSRNPLCELSGLCARIRAWIEAPAPNCSR